MIDNPTAKIIRTYLPLLKNQLQVKKDFIEIEFKSQKSYKNLLTLSYHKNNLIHVFMNEAAIALSIFALKQLDYKEKEITVEKIWESTEFISQMFKYEVIVKDHIKNYA
jgi:glycerol-3-phosphate O-acyltransferase